MRSIIKNHLSVTKKDWNGMVVLVALIVLILAVPYVFQLLHKDSIINPKDLDNAIAVLERAKK